MECGLVRQPRSGRSRSAWWMRRVSSTASYPCIIPCGLVVALRLGVETGKHTIRVGRQLEIVFDDERRVRVVNQVFLGDPVVLDSIANDAAEESDVRAGANLAEEIGDRGGAREAWVDRDYLRVSRAFRFDRPLESARMVLGRITPHDEHHAGFLHGHQAFGHRPASERWSQT